MTAREFLENKYPQMRGEKWNSDPSIDDNWIAQMMTEFAHQTNKVTFEQRVEIAKALAVALISDRNENWRSIANDFDTALAFRLEQTIRVIENEGGEQ